MYQTTISSVNGNMAADINGRSFYIAGSNIVTPGQQVWTDGKVIYGNTYTGGQSYIPTPILNGLVWLIPRQEIQVIDKSLEKVKKLCNTSAGYITYDKKNFNAFIGGHWQKLPAINDYTVLDACYNKDGDLLEIGYTGKPLYAKGYKGKTETLHMLEEESNVQGGLGRYWQYRYTYNHEYQAFYDYTDKTDGNPDFVILVKNGEVEKSLNLQSVLNSLESDLDSHASANMGMQVKYKMYESFSPAKYQMTRNQDGGYTCMLSVSCLYVAYCIKFRKIKEYSSGGAVGEWWSPQTDCHYFAKILAEWRVLITDKGTQIIDKNYSASGLGSCRGYFKDPHPGDSADWPCYYMWDAQGYGGELSDVVDKEKIKKGVEIWHYYTGYDYERYISGFEGNKWIVTRDGPDHQIQTWPIGNFSDPDFFNSQAKSENIGSYSWRLDHGCITFDDQKTTLEVNGCSFDWWTNTIFYAYTYKEGFLFVVFYMRESKIKLIYWDGKSQKEVASCPYVGDYCRAFRICEIKNTAKIKRLAGVENG